MGRGVESRQSPSPRRRWRDCQARAQANAKVSEADPQAVALGYKDDTTKVDEKKFPKHTASQKCAGCQLFMAPATQPLGPCGVFGGKNVSANGWCSAWVKKTT